MRGTVAKKIRKYIRTKYHYLVDSTGYKENSATGQVVVAAGCKRSLYLHMKREFMKRKAYES